MTEQNKNVEVPMQKVLSKLRSQLEKVTYQNIMLQAKHEQELEQYQAVIEDLQDKLKKSHTFNNKQTSSQKRKEKRESTEVMETKSKDE